MVDVDFVFFLPNMNYYSSMFFICEEKEPLIRIMDEIYTNENNVWNLKDDNYVRVLKPLIKYLDIGDRYFSMRTFHDIDIQASLMENECDLFYKFLNGESEFPFHPSKYIRSFCNFYEDWCKDYKINIKQLKIG